MKMFFRRSSLWMFVTIKMHNRFKNIWVQWGETSRTILFSIHWHIYYFFCVKEMIVGGMSIIEQYSFTSIVVHRNLYYIKFPFKQLCICAVDRLLSINCPDSVFMNIFRYIWQQERALRDCIASSVWSVWHHLYGLYCIICMVCMSSPVWSVWHHLYNLYGIICMVCMVTSVWSVCLHLYGLYGIICMVCMASSVWSV